MSHIPGTIGAFTLDLGPGWLEAERLPEPGWTLRSGPSGACYRCIHVRDVDARSIEPGWRRFRLTVERLGYDALEEEEVDVVTFPRGRGR